MGSIPGSGKSPGGGNDNPLQDSCLENSTDRHSPWGRLQLDTTGHPHKDNCREEKDRLEGNEKKAKSRNRAAGELGVAAEGPHVNLPHNRHVSTENLGCFKASGLEDGCKASLGTWSLSLRSPEVTA